MPIPVTCPGCLARFTVSDKYAGKQGPCPKCKQTITVPDKSQEVVIHAPENYGPKDAGGRPVLKPIKRVEFTPNGFQIVVAIGVAAVSIIVWDHTADLGSRIRRYCPCLSAMLDRLYVLQG